MFPTLADLFEYLFHIRLPLPIQTFGFFVALAFLLPYYVFRSEFKRKEADGLIHAFKQTEWIGVPVSPLELFVNGLLGFVFGFKVIAAVSSYKIFANDPVRFIFSTDGNWIAGIICGALFAGWAYYDRKKAQLPKPVQVETWVHPYQLTGYLVFMLGFIGFIGAKLFDIAEHFQAFLFRPVPLLFSSGGFTYYGGLIFGSLTYLYICSRRGMKLVHLADIGSPGMMLAYGVGRIGCELSGDGDWGIINTHLKPGWLNWLPDWMWASKYPHNVIDAGVPIMGCLGEHCKILAAGVYPTSFYEAAICLLLFGLMWVFRWRIRVPGLMFYLYLILNGTERILMEQIRITDRHRFLGLVFTQAELICVLIIAGGITGIIYIITKPKQTFLN
jgi:phosphatidylglycerol:prolipoprotein diacylglycerol transferase